MASTPTDPLTRFSEALSAPADSKEQATLLATLREQLEAHQNTIPILCQTLLATLGSSSDSLLKRWVLDLLHFGICVSGLTPETRTTRAFSSPRSVREIVFNLRFT